jgi:hypothetical protein
MMFQNIFISLVVTVIAQGFVFAQDSVVGLLKNNLRQGNTYYEQGDYEKALKSFELISHNKLNSETEFRIARCYYFMKKYTLAVGMYAKLESVNSLPLPDLFYYAELNTSVGNYSKALECYNRILSIKPRDPAILQRIWQLNNVHLFFEDSLHYAVRKLPVNSQHADLSPVPFHHGIVFLSDRKEIDFKNPDKGDNEVNELDFNLFYSEIISDTIVPGLSAKFKNPINFGKGFHASTGLGPVSFYDDDTKCIFGGLSKEVSIDGVNKMQLFFSENNNGKWSTPRSFEHNNKEYNLTDPSISADGKTLYFSSDKPGGFGHSDIYRCVLKDGKWTVPENLGDQINTGYHESFPFLYYNTLYFSSDGHPGLGGLDIFYSIISMDNNHDIKNLGHPLNSGSDDFGFVLKTGSHGYFTSNRNNEGYDDDLYEFEMDFRAYPFDITGIIKVRDSNGADTLNNNPMTRAKIELVDYGRNQVVARTQTDGQGKFSVSIPYFSKYVLRLFDNENVEYIVSLEINRESSKNSDYEIVVIKQSLNGIQKAN